jgi:hypothetical protein
MILFGRDWDMNNRGRTAGPHSNFEENEHVHNEKAQTVLRIQEYCADRVAAGIGPVYGLRRIPGMGAGESAAAF